MSGGSLANSMRETRMWLDHHQVMPHAFRESACPQGLALHIEFNGQRDAEEFVARFHGRVFGARPEWSNEAPRRRVALNRSCSLNFLQLRQRPSTVNVPVSAAQRGKASWPQTVI